MLRVKVGRITRVIFGRLWFLNWLLSLSFASHRFSRAEQALAVLHQLHIWSQVVWNTLCCLLVLVCAPFWTRSISLLSVLTRAATMLSRALCHFLSWFSKSTSVVLRPLVRRETKQKPQVRQYSYTVGTVERSSDALFLRSMWNKWQHTQSKWAWINIQSKWLKTMLDWKFKNVFERDVVYYRQSAGHECDSRLSWEW